MLWEKFIFGQFLSSCLTEIGSLIVGDHTFHIQFHNACITCIFGNISNYLIIYSNETITTSV